MKTKITILISLIAISCGQRTNNIVPPSVQFESVNEIEKPIENKKTYDLDSIVMDNYIITFKDAEPFATTDNFGDFEYRKKLTDTLSNWHDRAKKIQEYLQTKYPKYFSTTDSTLILNLTNGQTLSFPFWDEENEEGFNFEHYYEKIDYYLLRVQWVEGNCWLMINRQNGFKKYINGLPYISNQNDKFLAINVDLEAEYSFNGLELYSVTSDSLTNEFTHGTTWGPDNIKWINDNQFLVKREYYQGDGFNNKKIDYKLGTIKKKTSR